MRVCHFHGDRPGVGICMRCRVVICADCCTRLNGVNHCHACLKALGNRRQETRRRGGLWAVTAAVALGAAGLFLFGVCWLASGMMAP
jgi:hypothetical protein